MNITPPLWGVRFHESVSKHQCLYQGTWPVKFREEMAGNTSIEAREPNCQAKEQGVWIRLL